MLLYIYKMGLHWYFWFAVKTADNTASRHKLAATNLIGPNRQISFCTVFKTNKKRKCNNNRPFTIAISF